MSSIPPHYSERYVNQRYNKALHIVQHLPASSSFQPNKDEKLQLYSLYKQVAHGDVNTQRPGIFDVVGRAKWDAWKKLQGLSTLEAKHRYVDTLLKVCAEAYRKPAAKAQVQQIIQSFATIQSTSDNDGSDDSDDDDEEEEYDDGETSESVDEEEQAYLMDIQHSVPGMVPSKSASTVGSQFSDSYHSLRSPTSTRTKQNNRLSWNGKQPHRPLLRRIPSMESTTTMVTAPNAPHRRLSSRASSVATTLTVTNNNNNNTNHNNAAGMRPPSTMSYRSEHQPQRTTRRTRPPSSTLYDDHLDNNVNPWATLQDNSNNNNNNNNNRYDDRTKGDDSSNDSIDEEYRQNQLYASQPHHLTTGPTPTTARSSSSAASFYHYQQTNQQQQHDLSLQSPLLEGSVTSMTTAGAPSEPRPNHSNIVGNTLLTDQQYTSVVALGPATKRALETLQAEIIALNQRIDGLRQELINQDQDRMMKKPAPPTNGTKEDADKEAWNAWRWVLKAALKHVTVNLMTVFLIVFFLYKRGNPFANAIIGSLLKQWYMFKVGFLKNSKRVA